MAKFIKKNLGKFLLTLSLGILLVGGFLLLQNLSVKAQEQIKIIPESFSGDWQNPQAVFSQDLASTATLEEFNAANSAYLLEILEEELPKEEIEPAPEIPMEEIATTTEEVATTTEEVATTTEEVVSPPEPEQEMTISTDEGITTSTDEGITTSTEEVIEETATTTDATTTVKINKSSFLARIWTKLKTLFNSEAQAESSVCKNGSNRPCSTSVGVCQIGVQICQQGVWGKCIGAVMPSLEICDGVDNDCDGEIDEGVICGSGTPSSTCQHGSNQPCGTSVGVCQIGVQICQQGVWGKCIGAVMPSQEICDDVDNDCDGQVDEGVCGGVPSLATPQTERTLILSGFNISSPENTKIKLAQLRLSLAGKGEIGDKLVIDYFYQHIWQNLAIFDLENEISNNLNGGYFLYGLPIFLTWEDLASLKIKFTFLSEKQNSSSLVYLEAAWLELETDEVIEEVRTSDNKRFSLKSIKKDWRRDEEPEFEIEEMPQSFLTKFGSVFQKKEIKTTLIGPQGGENLEQVIIQDNKIKINQTNLRGFRPGLYKLEVKIIEGGEEFIQIQEFTWGVLAINTSKSIYLPNEQAYLQMAALRDDGHTICDANLELEILSPEGGLTSVNVERSGECSGDNVTDVPDYFSYYQVAGAGIYQMELINMDNGYQITDSFEVHEQVPFDVERIGPTRIYPLEPYPVTFSIMSNQDFEGVVEERVPIGFEISQPLYSQKYNSVSVEGNTKIIKWQVFLTAGEQIQLGYYFDAPDISPYIYLLGPLKIGDFQEIRLWQIAADTPAGPKYPGTITTVGTVSPWVSAPWNSPDNAKLDDEVYVDCGTADLDKNYTYQLQATNFGFNIPTNATINGIVVDYGRYSPDATNVVDDLVQLIILGDRWGDNKSAAAVFPIADATSTFGAIDNLWGWTTSTADVINQTNFGVAVAVLSSVNNAQAEIDFLRMTVYYTEFGANDPPEVSWLTGLHDDVNITIPEWATGAGNNYYQATTTFSVTDANGWADISTTTIFVYRSGVVGNCSSTDDLDINNCYPSTSTSAWNPTDGAGDVCDQYGNNGSDTAYFWCTTTIYYVAEPTDASAPDYSGESWIAYASSSDLSWAQDVLVGTLGDKGGVEVTTNPAVKVFPDTINYSALAGNLEPLTNTGNNWATTTATTTGNRIVDIHFHGGHLTADGQTAIKAFNQQFTTTSNQTYGTCLDSDCWQVPTSTDYGFAGKTYDLTMKKPTTTDPGPVAADEVYWGIGIPTGQAADTYSSSTELIATSTVQNP